MDTYATVPLTANRSHAGLPGTAHVPGQHGFEWMIAPTYSRSELSGYAVEPGDPAESRLLPGSPKAVNWPADYASVEPRGGTDAQGTSQIAIFVANDADDLPLTNYPVHPNVKAAVEAGLAAVHGQNTTPPITRININSTRREDSHVHSQGRAMDINRINGQPVRCAHGDFRRSDDCKGLTDPAIANMQKWVTALSEAFWKDCRVNQMLGPVRNRNKWAHKGTGENPHEVTNKKTIKKHRDHMHVNVYRQVKKTCP